jgi:molybdopterin converting factor small subunit
MNIRVLFFGAARDAVEANQLDLALEEPATVSSAFQSLKTRFSKLERFGRSLLFAVNQEYATPMWVRWRGVLCCRNAARR